MRKVNYEVVFKAKLSDIEVKGIEVIVDNLHKKHIINANADRLGLAYTSSCNYYAMLGVCNGGDFKYDGNKISHFAISENDMLVMVCEDEDENTIYYEVEFENFY